MNAGLDAQAHGHCLQQGGGALQGQVRMAKGIQVIHCASCGHHDCGQPPPAVLPDDAWVVMLGCRLEAPQQTSPEAIAEATAPAPAAPTPEQMATFQHLMELAKQPAPVRSIPIAQ